MRSIRSWMMRVTAWLSRERHDRDLAAELESHLQMHIDENLEAGMSAQAARRQALVALGGLDVTKEQHREQRGFPWVDSFGQDIRFGARMLVKHWPFTIIAVSTLTIGIAVNLLVFSVGYANLMPLPAVQEPNRLVRVFSSETSNVYYADYLEFRDRNRTLVALAAVQSQGLTLRTEGPPAYVPAALVSGNYFNTIGIRPSLGRVLEPSDDMAGAEGVVVLSDGAWRRRFGADSSILGHVMILNGYPFTVIGVVPNFFAGPFVPSDLYIAWNAPGMAPRPEEVVARRGRSAQLIGRLGPSTSLADVQADLGSVATDLGRRYPDTNRDRTVAVYPARMLPPALERPVVRFLSVLGVVTGLVLLIACLNIASMLLARWMTRQQEISLRVALGAGRRRLVRQLLTEGLLLSVIACLTGVAIFVVGARFLAATPVAVSPGAPVTIEPPFTWGVFAFGGMLGLATTLLFGLAPALRSSAMVVMPSLKQGLTPGTPSRSRLRTGLIVGQIATSTILLIIAGILVRSVANAGAIDVGFERAHVLTATIDVTAHGYPTERGAVFYDTLLERIEGTPGVVRASFAELVPLTLANRTVGIWKDGEQPPVDRRLQMLAVTNNISRGYFDTIGIAVVGGRDFSANDRAQTPLVAIINEALARRLWPGENALGRTFRTGNPAAGGVALEVVGVVRDSKYVSVTEDTRSAFYRPLSQRFAASITILVRTIGESLALLPAVQSSVQALDPDLAVFAASTLESDTQLTLLPVRLAAAVATTLGIVALALTVIGIYGVMSYVVRQRTREIGIRLALGARRSEVVRLLTRQGLAWTVSGIAVGLLLAFAVTRLLGGLLYGVSPNDPIAFVGIAAVLMATAYAACYIPGRLATSADPLAALRDE